MENKQTKKYGDITNDKLVEQEQKKGEDQLKRGGMMAIKPKEGTRRELSLDGTQSPSLTR